MSVSSVKSAVDSAVVSIVKVRELAGPNVWRPAPVVEARIHLGATADRLRASPRGIFEKLDAALAKLGGLAASRAALAGDCNAPPLPKSDGDASIVRMANAFARTAQQFQAIVGDSKLSNDAFASGRPSPQASELLAAIESGHIEMAREAFDATAKLFNAALGGTAFDRPAAFRSLIAVARVVEPPACTTALVMAARRRDIPLRRLDSAGALLLGQGTRSRRVPLPAAGETVELLYPDGASGRIPIVAVTGVNGKTTTTRLTAHILAACGHTVGMTCTEGVFIGGMRIESGDCSGPQSAQNVLANPRVDAAALEAARGGILRAGLGFDWCDVAIVTNIGDGDHLGLAGIETTAELARVKRVLVEAVGPRGAAVLKADDPLVAAMAPHCRGAVVLFSRRGDHPLMVERRRQGGRVAFVRDGAIILAEGEAEFALLALDRIPLTHRGRIGFQIENALAATAATWALGKPCELIRLGLETFSAGMNDLPGRFNLLEYNGATVILDYGHNASSLAAIVEALLQFPHKRRSAVYSAAGDRRDGDLVRQGEVLGEAFDRVILFEDNYRRGRAPGEIISLFRQGLASARRTTAIHEAHSWREAVDLALSQLAAGDLLVVQADEIDEMVAWLTRRLSEDSSIREIDLDLANRPHWLASAAAVNT